MNNPIEGEENFENGNEESGQNGVSKINLLEASNSNQEWNHDQIIQKPNGGMESNEENEEWFVIVEKVVGKVIFIYSFTSVEENLLQWKVV